MSNILDFFANILNINTVQTLVGFVMSNKLPETDSSSRRPRLLDEVRARLCVKHYSIRTETAYTGWIRLSILFIAGRHPATIDLHPNSSVVTATDEEDRVVAEKPLPDDLVKIFEFLLPWKVELTGVVVETTFGWYWLVDGLKAAAIRFPHR